MPRDTHGNFDRVIEISRSFFVGQAEFTLDLPPQEISSGSSDDFQFTGQVRPELRNVWFGDPGESFDPASGTWTPAQQVYAFNAILFSLELTGEIYIQRIRVDPDPFTKVILGRPVTIDLPPISFGVPFIHQRLGLSETDLNERYRRLNIHVALWLTAPTTSEQLSVRTARDQNFPILIDGSALKTLCAVALMPTESDPFIQVEVDMALVRDSPFTKWAVETVNALPDALVGPSGPEALVIDPIEQTLREEVETQIVETLRNTCDWKLDKASRIGLVTTTRETNPPVAGMDVLTTFKSLRVFMQTTGSFGQRQLATRSQLLPATTTRAADDLVITINGKELVQGLRESLMETFGLQSDDFLETEPCTVNPSEDTPIDITLKGKPYKLLYLQAGVNEASRLILWFYLRTEQAAATIDIEIEIPFSLSVVRAVRGGKQVLLIISRAGQAEYGVKADTFPVYHWIVEAIAAGIVNDALDRLPPMAPTIAETPQNMLIGVNSVSLNQAGAPREARTWPNLFRLIGGGVGIGTVSEPAGLHPGRFRDHDLVIHLSASRYPSPLSVACIEPDMSDPLRRIDGVGGTFALGPGRPTEVWAMPVDDAIDWIASGEGLRTDDAQVIMGRKPDDCPPVNPTNLSIPYLRTSQDTTETNNLANLPPCYAPGGAAARTTERLSDTFVHWRDVVPIGSRGDDLVNPGVEVDSSCLVSDVVLEMIDKDQSTVRATHRFGGPDAIVGGGGARMTTNPIGTSSLQVEVHWWFDAYSVCRYRLRYTLQGLSCS